MSLYRTFTEDDFLLQEEKMGYQRGKKPSTFAWNARRLFLSELEFLTRFWNPQISNPQVVYLGHSVDHLKYLSDLLPQLKFHIYTANSAVKISPSSSLIFHNEDFSDEVASSWKRVRSSNTSVYFISNLLTFTSEESSREEVNISDLRDQERWFSLMNPNSAFLRFRLPYPDVSKVSEFEYLDGFVFKQPWSLPDSAETRLVPFGTQRKIWSTSDYDERMVFHNVEIRQKYRYFNLLDGTENPISPQLNNSFDPTCEVAIFRDYLNKVSGPEVVNKENILYLSNLLSSTLNQGVAPEKQRTLP
ncbi:polyA polymerase reg subunit [Pithovirus sibericum]|uniref:Cap-specific mRNA (nucleoside-2'-O-)-methyltransferase n=1 Tax=Pithovirus sibericum TaxID=1450746 RepID=W5SB35_9VIRU|nr:polyA polymerase reg subunit [Pithovirus sibericum]AHH02010.1 polyA polymerase reg subunit [Pithovirus sibericum]